MARVDFDQRRVSCSVHDLLPEVIQRGIGGGWGEGFARLSVGAELHRTVQEHRRAERPGYQTEVPVDALLAIDGWQLAIAGRADGVERSEGQRPVVEEVKTLHFRSEVNGLFAHERLERFRWQARIYAYCLFPDGAADVHLVLADLGGEELLVEPVAWSPGQVKAWLRGRLHAMVALGREREAERAVWRGAAAALPFPHAALRPVQVDAMRAVEETLRSGRHLLLQAPTGVGKTAAALYPAIKVALETGRRVAILTAKTPQQTLAVATLERMHTQGWRSLQLRAKTKMCANSEVICHEEFCVFARDYGVKLQQRAVVPTALAGAPHLDPDRIFDIAKAAEVCPFEVSLELLRHVTAVVCDYNYVFDPAIALGGLADEASLEDTYLVIDEAHNLLDRAREYHSPRLGLRGTEAARALIDGRRAKVCCDLVDLLDELAELIRTTVSAAVANRTACAERDLPLASLIELRLAFDALIPDYFTYKRNTRLWLAEDPVIRVLLDLARLVDVLADGGREFVTLAERTGGATSDEVIRVFCLDTSRFTGQVLDRCAGAIAMSATMEPFEFHRDLLGFDPDRTDSLALPSPFPPENRLILAIDEVDTSFRERDHHWGRIADLIAELAPVGRNALALFPSYAFLRQVSDRLVAPGHTIEIQRGDFSDAARANLLRRLTGRREPMLLLAVLGGAFAEGVDYPGDTLATVFVISPALPQVGPERELLKRYYADRFERGFEYAYLVPGMTRVIQAAGRLIRSAEDRGVIVLICRRFLREPYSTLLPAEWTGDDPDSLRHPDPAAAVREFFASDPRTS